MLIDILEPAKGSNPGGVCKVRGNTEFERAYFKFVFGTHMRGGSNFNPQHQPIYEALTFELARKFGLDTVNYAVLLNEKKDVVFENWKNNGFNNNPAGRASYFVSEIFRLPQWALRKAEGAPFVDFHDDARELIGLQQLYLDTLLISDIVGKRQNYLVIKNWPCAGNTRHTRASTAGRQCRPNRSLCQPETFRPRSRRPTAP